MAEIIIENTKKSKKWLWILLVIVAIIVAAGVFYYFWKIAGNGSDVITDGGNSEVIIGGGLPEGFPSGLPIMAGTILQSQETKYESGIVQAISYSSTESLIKIYNDYFKSYLFLLKKISPLFFALIIFSCASRKDVVYYQNIDTLSKPKESISYEIKIQTDDLLMIIVSAEDQERCLLQFRSSSKPSYA